MIISSAPPLTQAQSAAQGVLDTNTMGFLNLVASFKESFARVWLRQDGVTPQQVFDAFGTDAGKLFAGAQATSQFIAAFAAVNGQSIDAYLARAEYTPPLPYTINADGTVTVQPPSPAATPAA